MLDVEHGGVKFLDDCTDMSNKVLVQLFQISKQDLSDYL